jgi:hypothetical protein
LGRIQPNMPSVSRHLRYTATDTTTTMLLPRDEMIHIGQVDLTEPCTISIAQDISIHIQDEHLTVAHAQWQADVHYDRNDIAGDSNLIHYVIDPGKRTILLLNDEGSILYAADSDTRALVPFVHLSATRADLTDGLSYNPGGLLRTQFRPLADGVLLIYEGGILRVDVRPELSLRWRIDHPFIDWFFDTIQNDIAWYVAEYDGHWGYHLVDGQRVDGPRANSE